MEQPCRVLSSNGLQLRSDLGLHHAIVVENKRGKPVVCQVYPRRIEGATDLAIQAAARLLEENGRGIVLRRCSVRCRSVAIPSSFCRASPWARIRFSAAFRTSLSAARVTARFANAIVAACRLA